MRIRSVKVHKQVQCVSKFRGQYPRSFFVSSFISFPSNQVEQFASSAVFVDFGIQDFGDLEFWFSIDNNGRWRWLNPIRNGIGREGF